MRAAIVGNAVEALGTMLLAAWSTPGVSEFLAAMVGGSMTLLAQRWALSHDRGKEEARRQDQRRAFGWSIFFKTLETFEAMTALCQSVREARLRAASNQEYLWQTLQFPPHDWDSITCSDGELLFLVEKRQFDLMQRYQQALRALSNVIQSVRLYREMRVEFLTSTPSTMRGVQGTFEINDENRDILMPRIAHLTTLSDSLAEVITSQQTEIEQLLGDYTAAMKELVGERPELEMQGAENPVATVPSKPRAQDSTANPHPRKVPASAPGTPRSRLRSALARLLEG